MEDTIRTGVRKFAQVVKAAGTIYGKVFNFIGDMALANEDEIIALIMKNKDEVEKLGEELKDLTDQLK